MVFAEAAYELFGIHHARIISVSIAQVCLQALIIVLVNALREVIVNYLFHI